MTLFCVLGRPRLGPTLFLSTLRLATSTSGLVVSTGPKICQEFVSLTLFPLICLALCIQDYPMSICTPCLAFLPINSNLCNMGTCPFLCFNNGFRSSRHTMSTSYVSGITRGILVRHFIYSQGGRCKCV